MKTTLILLVALVSHLAFAEGPEDCLSQANTDAQFVFQSAVTNIANARGDAADPITSGAITSGSEGKGYNYTYQTNGAFWLDVKGSAMPQYNMGITVTLTSDCVISSIVAKQTQK